MVRVLALSSSVAHGAVGLSAIVPALQALGCEVMAVPAIVLSSRVGYAKIAGFTVPAETIAAMIGALDANGWLTEVDAILTGYLPEPGHVGAAEEAVRRLKEKKPSALYLCDPVMGDDPHGLYLAENTARHLCTRLLPLCDIMTPNRFELAWISGGKVSGWEEAAEAARQTGAPAVAATSVPGESGNALLTVLTSGDTVHATCTTRQAQVPHGTGDLFSALFLAHSLRMGTGPAALAAAAGGVSAVIAANAGREELDVGTSLSRLLQAAPAPLQRLR